MKLITISIAFSLWLFAAMYAQAQEMDHDTQTAVEQLTELKEKIIQEEKDALLTDVENINARLENQAITKEEAETLKQEAAERHALNIENRLAIIDNKVALLKRNGSVEEDEESGMVIRIGSSGKNNENDNVLYVGPKNKKRKYDRRTTSDLVFAFGLNNVITEGESLQDSDFKVAGSRFAELAGHGKHGFSKTPIGYGLSMVCLFNLIV